MRRLSCDEPFDGDDGSPRPSRVVRLVDMMGDGGRREPRASRPMASALENGGGVRIAKPSRSSVGDDARGGLKESVAAPTILSVSPEGMGETIAVVIALPPCGDSQKPRRVKLHLLVEQYAELRALGVPLDCGDISEEQVARLTEAGELCAAIHRGMAMLQYGDRSARRLVASLTAKGISRQMAEAAVAYLAQKGYVREDETARRRVRSDLRKGWGPRRIREDLRALGLESEAVEGAMEELSNVDFHELCAEVIRKKYGDPPAGREERKKMTAALMRLGYDLDHIHGAMRLLSRGMP